MARVKQKNLPAVKYNAGNMAWYSREMIRMINEMNKDVRSQMKMIFSEHNFAQPEVMANDANPVSLIERAIRALSEKWISRFIKRSTTLSKEMADKTVAGVDRSIERAFETNGMRINMQWTEAMAQRKDAIIAENVSLIRSIPEKHFTEVEGMVYRAVARGGDRKQLTDEIMEGFSKREGITRRRAVNIANDQIRKTTSALAAVRQQAAGITEGIWVHSAGQAHPRHRHVKANGTKFKLSEGLPVGDKGEYVLPATQVNCACSWRPVAPW